MESKPQDSKIRQVVKGANDLSLGISMVIAILLGLGLGYGLYKLTGHYWLIWVGLGYGVAAAVLNVIKAYKKLHKELDSLKYEEKYNFTKNINEKEVK
ncbi:hypothetical protein CQA66_03850 [Helicobacter aurati]|uniref:Arginine biosynthesis protein ArgJ n=2 Tax=Helicobacter aurati TaxID=137778 RepID=A0A3D8J5L3_9HELI|nr:hypothetical protein CQA66_03850 [Helicobacter aurati]